MQDIRSTAGGQEALESYLKKFENTSKYNCFQKNDQEGLILSFLLRFNDLVLSYISKHSLKRSHRPRVLSRTYDDSSPQINLYLQTIFLLFT